MPETISSWLFWLFIFSACCLGLTKSGRETAPTENKTRFHAVRHRRLAFLFSRHRDWRIFRYWKIVHRAWREAESSFAVLQPLTTRSGAKNFRAKIEPFSM